MSSNPESDLKVIANQILDQAKIALFAETDAALARKLKTNPMAISRIRKGKVPASLRLLLPLAVQYASAINRDLPS